MASQDIIARSATTTVPPSVRNQEEVAKLIDTTKCIGCKACQVACSEWNELRDEVGHNHGTYDNPQDLSAETWTLMRFTEHETDAGNLEWLIRKDGCMHCAEPGCLAACPSPGRSSSTPTASSISTRTTASAAAIASPVARSTFRASRKRITRPTNAPCVRTGWL
jgi:ferredoxin